VIFSTDTSDSGTEVGVQLGGGVNFQVSQAIGIRFAADYIRVSGDGDDLNAYRFAAGAVFPFQERALRRRRRVEALEATSY
jgi:opacity protein-like surface antigen